MKKAIVMIGETIDAKTARPAGSGALLRYKNINYIISAKHVIERISNPMILFNDKKGTPFGRSTSLLNEKLGVTWTFHPDRNVDLAAIPFGINVENDDLKSVSEKFFQPYDGVRDGEDVFFMGYPLSLTPRQRIIPVIRQGCIALKFDTETKIRDNIYPEKTMLIDGQVSGGNSGSPLFRKPTFIDIEKRSIGQYKSPMLFGIVTSHIASIIRDLNKKPIARENSGLGIVSSTDRVIELLEMIVI